MAKPSLEEKSKELLKYKITKKGKVPNPFTHDFIDEVNYLIKRGYVTKSGVNPVSLSYEITSKGRKWAYRE